MLLDDNCIRPDKIPDSLASRLFAKPKCPATQTFAQIIRLFIFFPPFPPKKLTSAITELLAEAVQASAISEATAYIFDER